MVIAVRFVLKKIFEKLLAYNFKNSLDNAHLQVLNMVQNE